MQPGCTLAGPARLPTDHGTFDLYAFTCDELAGEHAVLARGATTATPALLRVHSSCLTGDTLHSRRCDCGSQLDAALARIDQAGAGLLVYLNQEGRGIGLLNKVRAYALQDRGLDTVEANEALGLPADGRDFAAAACVLRRLGVGQVRLLTNNPGKVAALGGAGIEVVERVPLVTGVNGDNAQYLKVKAAKLGHIIE